MSTPPAMLRASRRLTSCAVLALLVAAGPALAQNPPPAAASPSAAPATSAAPPSPPPAPYSLPWQLRSVSPATAIRSDTAVAFYKDPKTSDIGATVVTSLLGSYKVASFFAPVVRLAFVGNSPPTGDGGVSFVNPVVGGAFGFKPSTDLRLGFFLGATAPIGMGGGDAPSKGTAGANGAAALARSAMDSSMFAVDYFAVFPGVDFAYVAKGITLQIEATVFQLFRVRGEAVQKDSSRTSLTSGLHVGYFFIPILSVGADLRYQRWLSTPASVAADPSGALRDTWTMAIGPRLHFKLGTSSWFRPGIAYARGLDDPMAARTYNIVQLDLPFVF